MPFKNPDEYKKYMRQYMQRYNKLRKTLLDAILALPPDHVEKTLGIKIPPEIRRKRVRRRRS